MSEAAPTLAHRVEYALFRGVATLSRALGDAGAARLGAALGRLAYRPFGVRRRVVEANLRAAFPDRGSAWIRRTARGAYAHLGREALTMLRLASLGREGLLARTRVTGLYSMRAALRRGRGVVGVTGHLGNWRITAAALTARGMPVDVVAQGQANPLFDRAVNRARERLGMRVIDRRRAPRQALRSLRAGRVVGFVADQDARRSGVFVPFFGRPASTHRGPALLAVRTGAPVFVVTALRSPDGGWDVRADPVEVDRAGATDDVVRRLTAAFTARLEMAARRAPEQYFWHHRRWKTAPAEEPTDPQDGI